MNKILEELEKLIQNEKEPNIKKALEMSKVQLLAINSFMESRENAIPNRKD